jgi:hypothetical protein
MPGANPLQEILHGFCEIIFSRPGNPQRRGIFADWLTALRIVQQLAYNGLARQKLGNLA